MAKFVVDVSVVLHLARHDVAVAPQHRLLAPTLLRSQLLSTLHEAVHGGALAAEAARAELATIGRMPIRLLGDAVLRRRAWEIADRVGAASTFDAEYLALTQLQADAYVTMDKARARAAKGIVEVATIDALTGRPRKT
jgi:predicted nucleic acid-binding protein